LKFVPSAQSKYPSLDSLSPNVIALRAPTFLTPPPNAPNHDVEPVRNLVQFLFVFLLINELCIGFSQATPFTSYYSKLEKANVERYIICVRKRDYT